ncbi:MAG TPA: hypothetical protein VIF09_00635, partial [Polyangiaceae bacterium]
HVVDASDAGMDEHLRTVANVLEELELLEIPRLLVMNKIDAADAAELRMLERTYPEALFVSATHRESTRPLIERIARELAGKWERSAKGPGVEPEVSLADEAVPPEEQEQVTTLDEMLRAAGKRRRSRTVA